MSAPNLPPPAGPGPDASKELAGAKKGGELADAASLGQVILAVFGRYAPFVVLGVLFFVGLYFGFKLVLDKSNTDINEIRNLYNEQTEARTKVLALAKNVDDKYERFLKEKEADIEKKATRLQELEDKNARLKKDVEDAASRSQALEDQIKNQTKAIEESRRLASGREAKVQELVQLLNSGDIVSNRVRALAGELANPSADVVNRLLEAFTAKPGAPSARELSRIVGCDEKKLRELMTRPGFAFWLLQSDSNGAAQSFTAVGKASPDSFENIVELRLASGRVESVHAFSQVYLVSTPDLDDLQLARAHLVYLPFEGGFLQSSQLQEPLTGPQWSFRAALEKAAFGAKVVALPEGADGRANLLDATTFLVRHKEVAEKDLLNRGYGIGEELKRVQKARSFQGSSVDSDHLKRIPPEAVKRLRDLYEAAAQRRFDDAKGFLGGDAKLQDLGAIGASVLDPDFRVIDVRPAVDGSADVTEFVVVTEHGLKRSVRSFARLEVKLRKDKQTNDWKLVGLEVLQVNRRGAPN